MKKINNDDFENLKKEIDNTKKMTLKEVATYLAINRSTVFRYIKNGSLKTFEIGNKKYILLSEVKRFLNENQNQNENENEKTIYFSLVDAAKLIGVSRGTIYNYVKNGKLKQNNLGKNPRISEKEIKKFLKI